jgi:two-component system cell cycle sensor histidine kinase/response regulator CckA
MEAVGQLAGGVAHEFKNLLMVIMNRARFALDRLPESSEAAGDLNEVLAATDRAAVLARQLLALSHRQPMKPEVVSIDDIIADCRSLVEPLVGENIEFRVEAGLRTGRIRADVAQIEQVVMNVAVNARDAMSPGGTLRVKTGNVLLGREDRYRLVDATDFSAGPYVMVEISDDGCGMPPDVKSRIFEPFFTTKDRGRGTGLGLSIVYGIVKQHGGYLAVESDAGSGTTLNIYFPSIEAESGD